MKTLPIMGKIMYMEHSNFYSIELLYVFPFENRIHFLYFLQESLNKHPIFALSPNSAVIQTKHDSLEWLQCFQLPKTESSHIFQEIANL